MNVVHSKSAKVMENLKPYAQGFEQDIHVHCCKRSIGTLLFSLAILITTRL